ncbi:SDR family oxidoreductase [Kitasatospora sp. NPDC091335]|uniref:SDR family oxidoreductase n=1 Tax=Kitasatospora sp. NPDC091335 TaxID=3364085 RepID=UPI00382FC4EA
MPKYTGRNAVVVGGTTGVGLAIAKRLVEGGARVLLTGGAAHGSAEAAARLGTAATLVACDTGDPGAAGAAGDVAEANAAALASAARSTLGTVDMLFVAAEPGAAQPQPQQQTEPQPESETQRYDRQFTAATKGAYLAVRALAPLVADDGAIVFTTVAADACRPGLPDAGVHAMTASAVHAFSHVLAVELADRGVRVNAVSPGAIGTPADGAARGPRRDAAPPLGRRGSVDDVARTALFLAADATFTTGTVLAVDGGLGCATARPGPAPRH